MTPNERAEQPWKLADAETWAAQMRSEGREVYIDARPDGEIAVVLERDTVTRTLRQLLKEVE